jgi:hypothetical protein
VHHSLCCVAPKSRARATIALALVIEPKFQANTWGSNVVLKRLAKVVVGQAARPSKVPRCADHAVAKPAPIFPHETHTCTPYLGLQPYYLLVKA